MMYPQQTGRWLSLCLEITRTAYQIWEGHCLLPNDQVGTAISRSAALLKYFVQIFPLSKIDLYITSYIGIIEMKETNRNFGFRLLGFHFKSLSYNIHNQYSSLLFSHTIHITKLLNRNRAGAQASKIYIYKPIVKK